MSWGVVASGYTTSGGSNGEVTHGEQLTLAHVGYTALGAVAGQLTVPTVPGQLTVPTVPGRGYFRADTPLEFVPNQTYVYNDNPSNKGGIVPVGGMVIDGYTVPAGTYVAQFREFTTDFYVTGSNSFLFRGCRIRGANRAPDTSILLLAGRGDCLSATVTWGVWELPMNNITKCRLKFLAVLAVLFIATTSVTLRRVSRQTETAMTS